MGKMMYRELVMIKNLRDSWDFTFDVSKTEFANIYTIDECISFLLSEFDFINTDDIVINTDEIYLNLKEPLPCINCGNSKQ
jgi:phage-related protein